jgi:2-haloacid dehalogenase
MESNASSIGNTPVSRRQFIASGVSAVAAAPLFARSLNLPRLKQFKAVAFDAFPIFDPRPVFKAASNLFPAKGSDLANQWRTSQFEYSWLRTAAGQYKDFWQITKDALLFAAKKTGVTLSPDVMDQLMNQYLQLNTWTDVKPSLDQLKNAGLRLCFLSNFTEEMLAANMKHSGIDNYFEAIISTDRAHTYKPTREAYELGQKTLGLKKDEILFVAFAGWDACGAKWFGYPTFWLNRLQATEEQLTVHPDGQGISFEELLKFINM